jgi:ATP-dependent protease ClpP protease subunit
MDYIENIFFLGHHVDDKIKNQFIGITMDLNGLDESKDTHLHINSLSGSISWTIC